MSYPNPRVIDDTVPEVEQEPVRCGHLPQDDCECFGNDQPSAAAVEAAESARCCDPGPYCDDLPGCELKPGGGFEQDVAAHLTRLDAERSPVTPAEERTGVSDVQHAVLGEIADLRRKVRANEGVTITYVAPEDILASLARIEQWTRGGAS